MVNLKSLKEILRKSRTAMQVKDEVAILNDSLRQLDSVDALYHPGPYWLGHQQPLVKHIRENGLENFRSGTLDRKDPAYIFRRFGAAEPRVKSPSPELSQQQWNRQRFETAAKYGRSKVQSQFRSSAFRWLATQVTPLKCMGTATHTSP